MYEIISDKGSIIGYYSTFDIAKSVRDCLEKDKNITGLKVQKSDIKN